MTNPKALKEVYVAPGGNEADVAELNTNDELISKIADVASGGGGGGVYVLGGDTTYDELKAAIEAGKMVRTEVQYSNRQSWYDILKYLEIDSNDDAFPYKAYFARPNVNENIIFAAASSDAPLTYYD